MSDAAPPLAKGRYRLVEQLGEGAMAKVYRAYDSRLEAWRAIKMLVPPMAQSRRVRERFATEAKTMAKLVHPNIVTVHDVVMDDGYAYMVMEWMGGGSLLDLVRKRGPIPPGEALYIVRCIASGLSEAHMQGVIHRDIKPENILISSKSVPKLADFGIARVASASHNFTRTGSTLGTVSYMSPEQRGDAKSVDPRSDLYSLAAVLYFLVAARKPFDLYAPNVDMRRFAGVPEPVFKLIRRATQHNPEDRFQSAAGLMQAIDRIGESYPVTPLDQDCTTLPPPEPEPAPQPSPSQRDTQDAYLDEVKTPPPVPIPSKQEPPGKSAERRNLVLGLVIGAVVAGALLGLMALFQ